MKTPIPMPSCLCPGCGELLDAAGRSQGPELPEPGDATLCAYCGQLCLYRKDLRLRLPSSQEMHELMNDHDLRREMMQAALDIKSGVYPIGQPMPVRKRSAQ